MSRKILTINELLNEYDTLTIQNKGFVDMPKDVRKTLWVEWVNAKYPDLVDCHFCGSTMKDSLEFLPSTPMVSFHRSGNLAEIQCNQCNLTFKGEFGIGLSVVAQWNAIGGA